MSEARIDGPFRFTTSHGKGSSGIDPAAWWKVVRIEIQPGGGQVTVAPRPISTGMFQESGRMRLENQKEEGAGRSGTHKPRLKA